MATKKSIPPSERLFPKPKTAFRQAVPVVVGLTVFTFAAPFIAQLLTRSN